MPQPSSLFERITPKDVERALSREHLDERDVAALLSDEAGPFLEEIAQRAQALTRRRFGRTMQLYAPLYLSNECVNRCTYCGFSQELMISRRTLSVEAVVREAEHLRAEGFRHLLLVAGEAPRSVSLEYLESVAFALRTSFDSLSLEVGTFDLSGYRRLVAAGVDGLTLYQETYQADVYRRVHLAGPKRNQERRLEAMRSAGVAGFRSLGIGALLGLSPWKHEGLALAKHGRALSHEFWQSRIAVSFPRIRAHAGQSEAPYPVSDRALVQLICAMRLALPDAELVLSTREPESLRNQLMGLGITRMSAGSRTNPGGYCSAEGAGEQFQIEDQRSPGEVAHSLVASGFDPVWKDFDRAFVAPAPPVSVTP